MNKVKNWLLTALTIIGAVADFAFGILEQIVVEDLGWSPKVVTYVRLVVVVAGALALKLQPPTRNPDKMMELAETMQDKK